MATNPIIVITFLSLCAIAGELARRVREKHSKRKRKTGDDNREL